MAGEGVDLVMRQASGGEMTRLRDRIRGDAMLFVRGGRRRSRVEGCRSNFGKRDADA